MNATVWRRLLEAVACGSRLRAIDVGGLLVLLVCSVSAPVAGQGAAAIEGRAVAEETGEPLEGVSIRVAPVGPGALTGSDGRYRIEGVEAGDYLLVARGVGYVDQTLRVRVEAGEQAVLDFVLTQRALALEGLVVTAGRREQQLEEVPAAIALRDVDQLRSEGFTFGTDEFRGVTGVSFRRGEGDGDEFPFVSIRGSTGVEGHLALIDGIPFVGIYDEPLLYQMPYDAVERIEVFKGPASALYGRGALYGAVNYLTRTPRASSARLTVSAGTDDYYRAEGLLQRVSANGAGLLLSASYEDYGGWRENGGRQVWNLFGKLRLVTGDRTAVTLYGNYADRSSELPNGIPLGADGEVVDVVVGRRGFLGYERPLHEQQAVLGAVRVEHRLRSGLDLAITGHARRIDRDVFWNFYDPFGFDPSRNVYGINGFRGDTRHDVAFGEVTARWQGGRHDIIGGFSAERGTVHEDSRWSGQFGSTPDCGFAFFLIEIDYREGRVVNGGHPCFVVELPYTRARMVNPVWGAFVQNEIAIGAELFLTLGGRYDSFRRTATFEPIEAASEGGTLRGEASAFSSRASLSRRYDGGQVYASYGRGFNSNFGPSFQWDPARYARPENRPTMIDSYELGWKGGAFGELLRWETAVFHTRQRNRLISIPNPDAATDPAAPANLITYGQRYASKGVELSAHLRPAAGTDLTIGYSYVDPEWKDYVLTAFGGAEFDLSGATPVGVAPHILHLAAAQRLAPWLSVRASFDFYDDYQVTQDNSVASGGYELLTLGSSIRPGRWRDVSLDLNLTNALDAEYYYHFGGRTDPTYATPGEPRQLRAVVRMGL